MSWRRFFLPFSLFPPPPPTVCSTGSLVTRLEEGWQEKRRFWDGCIRGDTGTFCPLLRQQDCSSFFHSKRKLSSEKQSLMFPIMFQICQGWLHLNSCKINVSSWRRSLKSTEKETEYLCKNILKTPRDIFWERMLLFYWFIELTLLYRNSMDVIAMKY